MFLFLSSHGSSLIGLPFPPSGCLLVVFVDVTCAVSLLHRRVRDLIRGVACRFCDRPCGRRFCALFLRRSPWRTDVFWLSVIFSFIVDRRGRRT